jgi:hypothetical protein
MTEPRERGGKVEDSPRLPKTEDDTARVLSESKLGVANPDDPAGESDDEALSQSKLGGGGGAKRKGRGGRRATPGAGG